LTLQTQSNVFSMEQGFSLSFGMILMVNYSEHHAIIGAQQTQTLSRELWLLQTIFHCLIGLMVSSHSKLL